MSRTRRLLLIGACTILFPAAAQGQADQGTVVIRVTAEGKPLDEAASSFVIVRQL
jgi:hypothetical protein